MEQLPFVVKLSVVESTEDGYWEVWCSNWDIATRLTYEQAAFIVTACNNFEKMVKLLKEFTLGEYICEGCGPKQECYNTCYHGKTFQLLSEIESGTPPPAPICKYPPTIKDETSGIDVENQAYKYWMEGYNAR